MKQKINSNIKEIDAIRWSVVERILLAFYENGSLKKSQIALKSGLKYNACMSYLKWLHDKMEFVKFELNDEQTEIKSVRLSSLGISFCKNKLFENECMIKNSSQHMFA
jgi:predicted transcriptional regulator